MGWKEEIQKWDDDLAVRMKLINEHEIIMDCKIAEAIEQGKLRGFVASRYKSMYKVRLREAGTLVCKRWRGKNRARVLNLKAGYRERHREELRAKSLAYYYAHREEVAARLREKRVLKKASA